MTVKVLLDTDIGSDIDDAVALAYLLAQPECELLGITTVSGEAQRRAQIASALCEVAGKKVPIFPGREAPLLKTQLQPQAPQATALDHWPHQDRFPIGQAASFMSSVIRAHPGEITLLSIGPLTNVAALFASDEEAPRLLKGIVSMCGMYSHRLTDRWQVEWNALLDPHAAAIVYGSDVKVHRSVGLEVTTQVRMGSAEVRSRFQHELLKPVLDFAEVYFTEHEELTFHDPLAAATLFDEGICHFTRGRVEVETTSERLAGLSSFQADPLGRHEVADGIDVPLFFERYFSVFR
jgi:purine nucleosidase